MKSQIEVIMNHDHDTKNTVQFKEVVDDDSYPAIGTIYIRKSYWARLGSPDHIKVIIVSPELADGREDGMDQEGMV
jgi:hypothetical protein